MLVRLQLLLLINPIFAAGLAQALGVAAGTIQGFGLVLVFWQSDRRAVSAFRPESPNLARGQGGGNEPPARIKKKRKQTPGLRAARPSGVSASTGTDDRGLGYLSAIEFTCRQVNLASTVWLKKRGLDAPLISNWRA